MLELIDDQGLQADIRRLVSQARAFAEMPLDGHPNVITAGWESSEWQIAQLTELALSLPPARLQWDVSGLLGQAFTFRGATP
eukprot:3588205-Rhodomonas_salina.1